MGSYDYLPFPVTEPPELAGSGKAPAVYPVAIIGAGPIGLAAAINLALKGIASVVLDDNNVVSVGSRAICWAQHSLEIMDRLGVGRRMLDKGVTWKTGRLFHRDQQVFEFDLQPDPGYQYPAFINLQQYYVEQYLVERCADFPDLIDLRFKNKVVAHEQNNDHVRVSIESAHGPYELKANYLLACDGAGSATRERMGLSFTGESFEEQFLIADVRMPEQPFESGEPERWFWFEPEFHSGQSALLHKQPDDIYRIDLQLGPDADPKKEVDEHSVIRRVQSMVGDKAFTLEWVSVYRFKCARIEKFVHDRVIFVGDSAHVVSPFGARGGNGGLHDVDNLGWKLAAVLNEQAPTELLGTYNAERGHGADVNIQNSARATNFMTPKSRTERILRDEVLAMAHDMPFARKLINSGRLSDPCSLAAFGMQSAHRDTIGSAGLPAPDLPLQRNGQPQWLSSLIGTGFTLLTIDGPKLDQMGCNQLNIQSGNAPADELTDPSGLSARRYRPGTTYLIRPDAYICDSFASAPSAKEVSQAIAQAHRGQHCTKAIVS